MTQKGRKPPDSDLIEADAAFHLAIVATTQNRHLLEAYSRLEGHMHLRRFWSVVTVKHLTRDPDLPTLAVRHHGAIVAGYEAKDVSAVKAAIQEHIELNIKTHVIAGVASATEGQAGASAVSSKP